METGEIPLTKYLEEKLSGKGGELITYWWRGVGASGASAGPMHVKYESLKEGS